MDNNLIEKTNLILKRVDKQILQELIDTLLDYSNREFYDNDLLNDILFRTIDSINFETQNRNILGILI